jgi:putative transposase
MLMAWRACEERRGAWKLCPKRITYYDQQPEVTELRKDRRFAKVAVDIQREPLRRVERAFQAFFRRVQAGPKPGYPPFGIPRTVTILSPGIGQD